MHKYSPNCYWRLTSLLAIKHICREDIAYVPECCIFCIFHVCAIDHKKTSHIMWQSVGISPCSASCTCQRTFTHNHTKHVSIHLRESVEIILTFIILQTPSVSVSLFLSLSLSLSFFFPYLIMDWKTAESFRIFLFHLVVVCPCQPACVWLLTHIQAVMVSFSSSSSRKAGLPPHPLTPLAFSRTEKTANHSHGSSIIL